VNAINLLVEILGTGKALFSPRSLLLSQWPQRAMRNPLHKSRTAKEVWVLCRGLCIKLLNTCFLSFFVVAKNVVNRC